jgi:hypothetical protein
MITLNRIFEIYNLDPKRIKIVRHGDKEIPILDTWQKDRNKLEAYQSYQLPKKYQNADAIAVFAPHYKTTALFLGLWDIQGFIQTSDFTEKLTDELEEHNLPSNWAKDHVRYNLRYNPVLEDLSERLVIEWGGSTVSWVQKKDKPVVEIKMLNSTEEFQSYDQTRLDYEELRKITQNPDSNITWVKALSSVKGVYLIVNKSNGMPYVGSAYGVKGFFGRWSDYAKSGHGGDIGLKEVDPYRFQFSILEIVSATATPDDVIARENLWKDKLKSREFGYNKSELHGVKK